MRGVLAPGCTIVLRPHCAKRFLRQRNVQRGIDLRDLALPIGVEAREIHMGDASLEGPERAFDTLRLPPGYGVATDTAPPRSTTARTRFSA